MTFAVSTNPFGRFLVRRRTTFTWIVPILLFISSWKWGIWNQAAYLSGLLLVIAGEAIRIWAAGYIEKDSVISTGGPYAHVRNPLYFGSFLLAIGYVLMSGLGVSPSPMIALIAWAAVIALFLLFHLAAIISEERFLREKFGSVYEAYLKAVPRLLPRPVPARQSSGEGGHFDWGQAVHNRELTTALITLIVCAAFAAEFFVKHYLAHLS
ncbi:MAG TPA: isoprenylcysteine carboxylmethyltransferase family protein [Capsulimonadaceae bacterium]|nr:isoprenylcysteine carboxylmethyltransferase family protein [Capsulimonadaceae bacterium]